MRPASPAPCTPTATAATWTPSSGLFSLYPLLAGSACRGSLLSYGQNRQPDTGSLVSYASMAFFRAPGAPIVNEIERYEFDRQGFVVIENLLTTGQIERPWRPRSTRSKSTPWPGSTRRRASAVRGAPEYHRDPDLGYHVRGARAERCTVIIEDFWNADSRLRPADRPSADHGLREQP